MDEQLEYLISAFRAHMIPSGDPVKAWKAALLDLAYIYYRTDEDRLLIAEMAQYHAEKKKPLPEPVRKYVDYEPLTVKQFVITDAVRGLAVGGNKLAAIKLIRGAFAKEDELFCSLTVAKEILDSILARR